MTSTSIIPRVYVSTFAKYVCGSIKGEWIDLEGLSEDTFLDLCRQIHFDESDPEIMIQDFEHIPKAFYSETGLSPKVWEWLSLDENDRDVVEAYSKAIGSSDFDISDALDRFQGRFESVEDYARECAENTCLEIPLWLQIDWTATWERALRYDVTHCEHFGMVYIFSN